VGAEMKVYAKPIIEEEFDSNSAIGASMKPVKVSPYVRSQQRSGQRAY